MVAESLISEFVRTQNRHLIQALGEISELQMYKKGETLYEPGEQYSGFYFLLKGAVCCYFPDEEQRETSVCFFTRRYDLLNIEDFHKVSTVGMRALMETEVLYIPAEKSCELMERYTELLWEYTRYLQRTMVYLCVIDNRRMYMPAEERYQWFCEKWPEAEKFASNQQVATFLRMRPESLSRLKSQIRKSGNEKKALSNIMVTRDLQWGYMDIKQRIDEN